MGTQVSPQQTNTHTGHLLSTSFFYILCFLSVFFSLYFSVSYLPLLFLYSHSQSYVLHLFTRSFFRSVSQQRPCILYVCLTLMRLVKVRESRLGSTPFRRIIFTHATVSSISHNCSCAPPHVSETLQMLIN